MIDRFAELSGDRFAAHLDDEYARRLGFPRRIAHGLLVLSVADGLKNQSPVKLDAIASLGWDMSFRAPVLAGDEVSAEFRVDSKRATRNASRGIVSFAVELANQDGRIVQRGLNRLMMTRKSSSGTPSVTKQSV